MKNILLGLILSNVAISFALDGKVYCCPADPNNTHYAEIMRQVEAGTLVIAEAE